MSPTEANEFINSLADKSIEEPENFEEQALKFIGKDCIRHFSTVIRKNNGAASLVRYLQVC